MSTYSYLNNGISFNIEDNAEYGFGKLAHENSAFKRGSIKYLINAVEIDWNGAQLGDKTLNTTGEVLSRYKIAI